MPTIEEDIARLRKSNTFGGPKHWLHQFRDDSELERTIRRVLAHFLAQPDYGEVMRVVGKIRDWWEPIEKSDVFVDSTLTLLMAELRTAYEGTK
jgi:hypothetical protein